ncbi:hypothetical protein HZS_154 [Henneguya salminicola]|nr:hypothetical protein HZS_154 [Henneguya salminicola]
MTSLILKNSPSILLKTEENEFLFGKMVSNTLKSLCTAVAQLYLTKSPNHGEWIIKHTGIVCLTRDATRKSFFIQVFNPSDALLVWEQELYVDFLFKMANKRFLTFEADVLNCMAALNFSSEAEAKSFSELLHSKLLQRKKTKEDNISVDSKTPKSIFFKSKKTMTNISKKLKKNEKKKNILTVSDISSPTSFVHLSHVGFDPNKGFDMNNIPSDWKKLFTSIGLTDNMLTDIKTSNFIFDYVQNAGGIENMKKVFYYQYIYENKTIPTIENSLQPKNAPPSLPPRVCSEKSLYDSKTSSKNTSGSSILECNEKFPSDINNETADNSAVHSKSDLLSQIQKGVRLRKKDGVIKTNTETSDTSSIDINDGGMVALLAQRLATMRSNLRI